MSELSSRLEVYIKSYEEQPTGREAEGTVELLKDVLEVVNEYDKLKENGQVVAVPCKVGDTAWVIDDDAEYSDNRKKIYRAKWTRVTLVQSEADTSFELHGEVCYEIYDFFCADGRTMPHAMYVGQEHTKVGEVVFFTKEEAEETLKKMEKQDSVKS